MSISGSSAKPHNFNLFPNLMSVTDVDDDALDGWVQRKPQKGSVRKNKLK